MQELVIFQGKDGLVAQQDLAAGILQVIEAAAGLGAFAPVGTPAGEVLRQIALPAVADAEGTVHEELDFGLHGRTDAADLFQGQLAFQD